MTPKSAEPTHVEFLRFHFFKFVVLLVFVLLTVLLPSVFAWAEPWMGHLQIKDEAVWRDGRAGNYGTIHYFIDETIAETVPFEVSVQVFPDGNPADALHVEVFTNLNRRDHAKIWESPTDVDKPDSYYKAIRMTHIGKAADGKNELYAVSLKAERTGAYRLTARFQIGDGPWHWHNGFHSDGVAQRDCAIVVSPRKVLSLTIYEVNPLVVEATAGGNEQQRSTFEDFTDHDHDGFNPFSLDHVRHTLGFNTIWLMPIFPNTRMQWSEREGEWIENYSPGSPYAARDYWTVSGRLSEAGTPEAALQEFQYLVNRAEDMGLNIFIDVALNHAGRDVVYGQGAVDLGLAASAEQEVRHERSSWGTNKNDFRRHANNEGELALYAPADRLGEHKWPDAGMDWYFGDYSSLGPKSAPGRDTSRGSAEDERDLLYTDLNPHEGHDVEVENIWNYFAHLFPYWLDRTGNKLDGIRADFAQGLPPRAWEYIINKTRQKKWDFVFLAEALDPDSVRYRVNRQFDLLTTVDHHLYRKSNLTMSELRGSLEFEAKLYGYNAAVLHNGTSHDEEGNKERWMIVARYAVAAAVHGVPMIFMAQPLGIQEEIDFEKSWQDIKQYWDGADSHVFMMYHRINEVREQHSGLRSTNRYFLQKQQGGGGFNENIFAVARWDRGDLIVVFVNLRNSEIGPERFVIPRDVPLDASPGVRYQAYNLLADNPNAPLWTEARTAADIHENGIFVQFSLPNEAQYIQLRPAP